MTPSNDNDYGFLKVKRDANFETLMTQDNMDRKQYDAYKATNENVVNAHFIMDFTKNKGVAYWTRFKGVKDEVAEEERVSNPSISFGNLVDEMFTKDTADLYAVVNKQPANPQQRAFADNICNGMEIETAYSYSYSKPDKKKANDLLIDLAEYIEVRKTSKKRMVNRKDYDALVSIFSSYNSHTFVKKYLKGTVVKDCTLIEKDLYNVGLDSLGRMDLVSLVKEDKTIYIVDYKTTRKNGFTEFGYEINSYQYSIQAAFYKKLVEKRIKGTQYEEYEVKFLWVAIRNAEPYTVEVYEASDNRLNYGINCIHSFFSFSETVLNNDLSNGGEAYYEGIGNKSPHAI